ncbi:hypothetical protein ES702_07190 [subsurface metagenome]
MRLLIDLTGLEYNLLELPNGKMRLQGRIHPEIYHDYKPGFMQRAIEGGLLKEIPSPIETDLEMEEGG